MPLACSTSQLTKYEQGLNDSQIVLDVNAPQVLIDVVLSYLDETKVARLHLMNSTHYVQINVNYLIDQYWNVLR